MVNNHHTVVMHSIAQLAFFGYCLLGLGAVVCPVGGRFDQVLVRIYHCLARNKADQDDPGVNDMLLTFFQNRYTMAFICQTHFSQK